MASMFFIFFFFFICSTMYVQSVHGDRKWSLTRMELPPAEEEEEIVVVEDAYTYTTHIVLRPSASVAAMNGDAYAICLVSERF